MNFHPIIVHFPIALLSLYCVMEFVRIKKISTKEFWFYTKAILVIIGSASTVPAVLAGKLIERNFPNVRYVIRIHSTWAQGTTLLFGLIAFCYVVAVLNRNNLFNIKLGGLFIPLWQLVTKVQKIILETKLIFLIALIGLIAISITGALGGIIVYGQNLDPFTNIIYNVFVKP